MPCASPSARRRRPATLRACCAKWRKRVADAAFFPRRDHWSGSYRLLTGARDQSADAHRAGDRPYTSAPLTTILVMLKDTDRKSVVSGKSVSVRVVIRGRRIIKKNNTKH